MAARLSHGPGPVVETIDAGPRVAHLGCPCLSPIFFSLWLANERTFIDAWEQRSPAAELSAIGRVEAKD